MKLFYWSLGGLVGLGALVWAIASFWPEPRKDVVQVVYVNEEQSETACYQFTAYNVLGFNWLEFLEVPAVEPPSGGSVKNCLGSQESFIWDCSGVDFQACKDVLRMAFEEYEPKDIDALIEQQKTAPSE